MRACLLPLTALLLVHSAAARAEPDGPAMPLRASVEVALADVGTSRTTAAPSPWATDEPRDAVRAATQMAQRGVSPRRILGVPPALFGALVGAAAGTAVAYGAWGAEGSFVGFWGGAGAGAVVGWLVTR